MKKKRIFWLIVALIVLALILFVKVIPAWASLTGVISFCCGVVSGWWGKIYHDRFIKEK